MRESAFLFVLAALLLLSSAGVSAVLAQCDYTAQRITPGQPMAGNVAGIQSIYYRFEVAAPGAYSIYTSGNADTYGQLLDANCQVLAENDDGGGDYGYNFHIERQLSPSTYYISVRGYNESVTGPFTLHLEVGGGQAGGGDCAGAQTISFGSSVDGVLSGTTPIYYRVALPGGSVRVYTSGNLDTVGQALDADCNVIDENDDGGGDYGYNFMFEGDAPAGTYYISVRGYSDNDRGPFTLHVEGGDGGQAGGGNCDNALPLTVGGSVSGMAQGQALQYYSFQVASAGTYSIYTSGDTDTVGMLLDPNCQMLTENDDGGGDYGYNFHIEQYLDIPGTYYVAVGGYREIAGPYTLHLEGSGGQAAGGDCAGAQDIPFGGSVDGVLNGITPIYYRVTSPGGQARAYTTGNFDTVGQALDANCHVIAENDDGGGNYGYNFLLEGEVPAGTYYISVRGYSDNDRGPFTLHVEGTGGDGGQTGPSDCSNALPLSIGGSVSGTVQGQTMQFYRFQVATPGAYSVYTSGDTDTYGQLLDANCQVLAENDDGGGTYGYNFHIEQQLSPGTYHVSVRGYGADTTGNFSLNVATAGGKPEPDTGGASEAEVRQVLEQFFQTMRNFDIDGVIGMSTARARQYFEGYRQQLQANPSYRDSEQQLATTLQWVVNDISFDSSGNVATANVNLTLGGATVPAAIALQREGGTWKVATGFAP